MTSAGAQETHTTNTTLYGANEGAAFPPAGAFQTAWLTLPQPNGAKKALDGPRADVADVTQWVYYPNDATVPGAWRGHLAAVRNPLGHIMRYEDYDVFGNPQTIVDPNAIVTRQTFDVMGRLATSTIAAIPGCDTTADPLCATDLATTRTYTPGTDYLATEQRPSGATTTYTYDSRGQVQTLTRGTSTAPFEQTAYTYDPNTGNKASQTLTAYENGTWVAKNTETYTYLSTGELHATTHADNTQEVRAYNPDRSLRSIQDENHTTPNTTYAYDALGRIVTVTQTLTSAPGGTISTTSTYDKGGNRTSLTDPNTNTTTWLYDDFGRLVQETSPVTGNTTFTYDSAGNQLTRTDANGSTIARTYDALNRPLTAIANRSTTTETTSWTYDDSNTFGIGRLSSVAEPTGTSTYAYERRGLLRSEQKTIGASTYTSAYTYDANGNRATIAYASGVVAQYTYDFADRQRTLTIDSTPIVTNATYLPFGPITSITYANNTTRTVQYDNRYRPQENKLTTPTTTLADYTYVSDNVGNITQLHDAVDPRYNRDFAYDDLHRLTTANSGTALWGTGSYTYDLMGNLQNASLGTRTFSATFVATTPKLSTVTQNGQQQSVTYDAAGNEAIVGTSTYVYSPRNTLSGAGNATYTYDARLLRTTTSTAYLGLSIVPSTITGGNTTAGTVTLATPATSDTTVLLASDNSGVATVPPSVTITAGQSSASFGIATSPVVVTTSVTINAAFNQYTTSAALTALQPDLVSVSLAPTTVSGGATSTGTVTLTGAAATNTIITLSSNNTAASVPSTVTVPAGSMSATFAVSTTSGVTNISVTITATLGTTARQAVLTFADAELSSLAIAPASVLNGGTATGTVTLTGTAGNNITISLGSSSADAYVPSSVIVPAGASSATFTIQSQLISPTSTTVTISATHGTVSRQATITINPPWLTGLIISPQTLLGGNSATAAATVNAPTPYSGSYTVTLRSSNTSLVATPQPITYYGETTGQTTVLTNPVLSSTPVVITATDPTGVSTSQTVTLQPPPVTLSALWS